MNFQANGKMIFAYSSESKHPEICYILDFETYAKQLHLPSDLLEDGKTVFLRTYNYDCSDLIPGKKFLSAVRSGCFIDYDGSIFHIFVDGYESNLGLLEGGICQGEFLVDGKAFEEICNTHEVIVDWANK